MGVCYYILRCFAFLAAIEKELKEIRAGPEKRLAVRGRKGRKVWKLISYFNLINAFEP